LWPIVRRGGPRAFDDHDDQLAALEAANCQPRSLIAHLHSASSGASGFPNPHPFAEVGWLFCHNGTITNDDVKLLASLIGQTYLLKHPLDYAADLDSEYLSTYLVKEVAYRAPQTSSEAAIRTALWIFDANSTGTSNSINFLLTDGERLWACRHTYAGGQEPFLYYRSLGPGSWHASKTPPNPTRAWMAVGNHRLVTLSPTHSPVFTPLLVKQ